VSHLKNDLFLRACRKEDIERTPIWIMRQAGRYLPEYRAVREKADFITMCKTPDLAAEVTVQPIDLIGVDAAILFSDILVIPEAMGMKFEMIESKGPVFHKPIKDESDINNLKIVDPSLDLKYVMDAISVTKKELFERVPLIGFSGSPWTLMAYMVEGSGSKAFSQVKSLIYNNPKLAHKLLSKISDAVSDYLSAKIESGVNAIQIFDTWGGLLTKEQYLEFSLKYIEQIIAKVKKDDTPVIVFSKGVFHSLEEISNTGTDVIGLDWTMDLGTARGQVGDKVALQGNLDPTSLYADKEVIHSEAEKVLNSFGKGNGHIFNLGHGILPDVPPENAKALVSYVQEQSAKYHN